MSVPTAAGILAIVSASISMFLSLVGLQNVSLRDYEHVYDPFLMSITLSIVLLGLMAGIMSLTRRHHILVTVGIYCLLLTLLHEELGNLNAFFHYEHLLFGSNMPRPMPSEVWAFVYLQVFLCFNAVAIGLSLASLVLVVRSRRVCMHLYSPTPNLSSRLTEWYSYSKRACSLGWISNQMEMSPAQSLFSV